MSSRGAHDNCMLRTAPRRIPVPGQALSLLWLRPERARGLVGASGDGVEVGEVHGGPIKCPAQAGS